MLNKICPLFSWNSTTNITIHQTGNSTIESIRIYNVLGEEVLKSEVKSGKLEEVVDVSNLKNGIYFIEVVAADSQIIRRKLVKE